MLSKLSYIRPQAGVLLQRLVEPRRFMQIVAGPRQVGKTTLVRQTLEASGLPYQYASADEPTLRGGQWIEQQWQAARRLAVERVAALALDEVQKIPDWSEAVKRLWDEDTGSGLALHVILLGSAPLLVQRGLSESLTGRFEMLRLPHWTFSEMRTAFGFSLDDYIFFGGYPGAAPLIEEPTRWARYVLDALIETTISRDVLLLTRVDKPALLRRLFELGCRYSGQVLSYTKMLGQLQDAGNSTTLAHYLDLLQGAGLLAGLPKFAGQAVRQRGASPKLQVLNTALISAQSGLTLMEARDDAEYWGRLVESAVGAHLANTAAESTHELFYWRERGQEVDFVLRSGRKLVGIEVKSSRPRGARAGLEEFSRAFSPDKILLVGGDGIPVEEFLAAPVEVWLGG